MTDNAFLPEAQPPRPILASLTPRRWRPRLVDAQWPRPSPAGARCVRVTFFRDRWARTKVEVETTLAGLAVRIQASHAAVKGDLRWLKLATFGEARSDKGSLRFDANVAAITGIEADYDGEQVSFDAACQMVRQAGLLALIYSSPSHSEDKPRWRVLCPTSAELTPDQRQRLVARLNGLFGGILANESLTLSQAYYYGSVGDNPPPLVEILDGDPIDLRPDLDAGAIGRPNRQGIAGAARTPSAEVIQLPGMRPATRAAHASGLTRAAQANLPAVHWFDALPAEQQNGMMRALAAHPRVIPLADAGRAVWWPLLMGFADADHRGATEARASALAWCKTSARFVSEADFDRDWLSFKPGMPGGITLGTLLDAAEKAGFDLSPWRDAARVSTSVVTGLPAAQGGAMPITGIPKRLSPAPAIDLMNRTFVYAMRWGNDNCIIQLSPNGRRVEGMSRQHLQEALSNRFVIDQSAQKPELMPLAKFWLSHPDRKEVDRVIFDPEDKHLKGEDTFNLWQGLAVQPQKGRWQLMARHLFMTICKKDRECWRYLIRWLAHAVQHPGTAPGAVIVLRSAAEGTGKTLVLDWMTTIFGEHGVLLSSPEEFIGDHNDHLENKSFIGLNEPSFPGDHRAAGKFKSMITDRQWTINPKHRKIYTIPNIAHIMLTTNAEWAVPAGNRSRRFLMLNVDDTHANDRFIKEVRQEGLNGGVEAMLHDLQCIDLTGFDPWTVPKTTALREQQLLTAPSPVRWAAAAVTRGELIPLDDPKLAPLLPNGRLPNGGFRQEIAGPMLYDAYARWCHNVRVRPIAENQFGMWLSSCGLTGRRSNGVTMRAIPDCRTFAAAVLRKAGIV